MNKDLMKLETEWEDLWTGEIKERYPYELTMTRQSVGRILNTLAAAGKIRWSQTYGAWVE